MNNKNKGFTLVEILIVVIILGILAAIVIPQFTEASNDARESALASDLQTCRSQLELYKVQHLDTYPTVANFVDQLISRTNQAGALMPVGGAVADYPYGPYLQKFPSNPFVSGATTNQVQAEAGDDNLGGGSHGWHFNTDMGAFAPDDDAHSSL